MACRASGSSRMFRSMESAIHGVDTPSRCDAEAQYLCAHRAARCADRARAALDRSLSADIAGYRPRLRGRASAGTADIVGLSGRLCARADRLWPDFGLVWPALRSAGGAGLLLSRQPDLSVCAVDRGADRRAGPAGIRRLRRDRAGAGGGARFLQRRARRQGIVDDGPGHGLWPGLGAADRRRAAYLVWMALGLCRIARLRTCADGDGHRASCRKRSPKSRMSACRCRRCSRAIAISSGSATSTCIC